VWRLKVAITTGGGGWGDWSYYEDEEKFREALLDAAISEAAEANRGRSRTWLASRWWRDRIQGKEGETARIERVVGADCLVNGKWEPVGYRLIPPHLEVSYSDDVRTEGKT
jgi:hypothetical protein